MLDPLTALGLASNVIQMVDFAAKLSNTLREIHTSTSRTTEENAAIESLSQSTKDAADGFIAQLSSNSATRSETHLLDSATHCSAASKAVLDLVGKMKRSTPGSFKQSLRELLLSIARCGNTLIRIT